MYIKSFMNRQHISILTAVVVLIMSFSTPMAAIASESEMPDVSTESGAESSTESGTESIPETSTDSVTESGTESTADAAGAESFHYQHDPMENPNAARDIVVNPEAVYGYSPSPDSVRLRQFVDYLDWTDKEEVEAARRERVEYHENFSILYRTIEDMLGQGKNEEEIARAVSKARNEIRLASYDGNPEGLADLKESNLQTYGHEEGPTPDQIYEKYGSWQAVIEKALSANPGVDACLGLYDEYYDTYDIPDRLSALRTEDESESTAAQAQTSDENENADAQTETAEKPGTTSGSSGTYRVKNGDCLWDIAASELGDGGRWQEIYELNKNEIDDPRLIYEGQEFVLPAA